MKTTEAEKANLADKLKGIKERITELEAMEPSDSVKEAIAHKTAQAAEVSAALRKLDKNTK